MTRCQRFTTWIHRCYLYRKNEFINNLTVDQMKEMDILFFLWNVFFSVPVLINFSAGGSSQILKGDLLRLYPLVLEALPDSRVKIRLLLGLYRLLLSPLSPDWLPLISRRLLNMRWAGLLWPLSQSCVPEMTILSSLTSHRAKSRDTPRIRVFRRDFSYIWWPLYFKLCV